jgi:hypothetical protein
VLIEGFEMFEEFEGFRVSGFGFRIKGSLWYSRKRFKCLRRSKVQKPAAFKGSIACGVQRFNCLWRSVIQMPAAAKGSIACGVQRFISLDIPIFKFSHSQIFKLSHYRISTLSH